MKLLLVIGMTILAPVFAQDPAGSRPHFEVASIKVHPPPLARIIVTTPPGRFIEEGFSLKMLVARAYGVPEIRVLGGPNWVESEHYDIEAKAERTIPQGQLPLMLQTLLEDRFQLKAHKETRELPVYELIVARGGVRMKLSEDQTPPAPIAPPGPGDRGVAARGAVPGGSRGGPGAGPIGGGPPPRGAFQAGRGNLQGIAVQITTLVNFLTNQLGRPVHDKTGLTRLYDIKLEWTPGAEQVPGPFGQNPDAPPPPPGDSSAPSLFTALQEQLGLRLESTRGPVEVVVIDGAGKPSEN